MTAEFRVHQIDPNSGEHVTSRTVAAQSPRHAAERAAEQWGLTEGQPLSTSELAGAPTGTKAFAVKRTYQTMALEVETQQDLAATRT